MRTEGAAPGDRGPSLRRFIAFVCVFGLGGPLLAFFGPPMLNRLEGFLGTIPQAPARPAGVPAEALPLQRDLHQWMWATCREEGDLRYTCRVFGPDGRLEAAGRFVAQAGYYKRQLQRLPAPGEPLKYSWYYEDQGEIALESPLAVRLRAEEWIYYPARGKKAAVLTPGSLDSETPMSPQEITRFPADPP